MCIGPWYVSPARCVPNLGRIGRVCGELYMGLAWPHMTCAHPSRSVVLFWAPAKWCVPTPTIAPNAYTCANTLRHDADEALIIICRHGTGGHHGRCGVRRMAPLPMVPPCTSYFESNGEAWARGSLTTGRSPSVAFRSTWGSANHHMPPATWRVLT